MIHRAEQWGVGVGLIIGNSKNMGPILINANMAMLNKQATRAEDRGISEI